jgi:hypothetical protein
MGRTTEFAFCNTCAINRWYVQHADVAQHSSKKPHWITATCGFVTTLAVAAERHSAHELLDHEPYLPVLVLHQRPDS